jgi:hypothetical protein
MRLCLWLYACMHDVLFSHVQNTHTLTHIEACRYKSSTCNGSSLYDTTRCTPCTSLCPEGTSTSDSCSGQTDVTCASPTDTASALLLKKPDMRYAVQGAIWFNVSASSFGRHYQATLRAVLAAVMHMPDDGDIILVWTLRDRDVPPLPLPRRLKHLLDPPDPRDHQRSLEVHGGAKRQPVNLHGGAKRQPVNLSAPPGNLRVNNEPNSGAVAAAQAQGQASVLVNFTAFFSDLAQARDAVMRTTSEELTRQIKEAALPDAASTLVILVQQTSLTATSHGQSNATADNGTVTPVIRANDTPVPFSSPQKLPEANQQEKNGGESSGERGDDAGTSQHLTMMIVGATFGVIAFILMVSLLIAFRFRMRLLKSESVGSMVHPYVGDNCPLWTQPAIHQPQTYSPMMTAGGNPDFNSWYMRGIRNV